jgi:hypothetical protein
MKLEKDRLIDALNAALLTDVEVALGEAHWQQLTDTFPQWEVIMPEDMTEEEQAELAASV